MPARPPSNRITLADVAARAGVSTMTVSRVVNGFDGVREGTRERVQRAIEELDYRPNAVARGLKGNRSGTLGLLVPDITNPYFPAIVRGAEDVAFEAGFTLLLNNVIEDLDREARALQAFEDRRVDGIIACSPRLSRRRLHALLRRQEAAVVINRHAPAEIAGSVRVEHEHGARLAVEHLHGVGRRRYGILAGPEGSVAGRERLRAGRAALRELDLPLANEAVVHGPPTVEGGVRAADELLERAPGLDALVCFNDLVAAGALQSLARRGRRIPDDVAVVGYDDIPFARMFAPPLTTLYVPTFELGAHAMRMLLDRMDGRYRTLGIILQPELMVRASTVGREGGAGPPR